MNAFYAFITLFTILAICIVSFSRSPFYDLPSPISREVAQNLLSARFVFVHRVALLMAVLKRP